MGRFTVAYIDGHSDLATTRAYVHPTAETVLAVMERAQEAQQLAQIEHNGTGSVPTTSIEEKSQQ